MTEKRFMIDVASELDENAVFCNGEFICLVDDTDNLVKVFNYLVKENEQLKSKIEVFKECITTANSLNEKIDELEKENEQLKQRIKELEE